MNEIGLTPHHSSNPFRGRYIRNRLGRHDRRVGPSDQTLDTLVESLVSKLHCRLHPCFDYLLLRSWLAKMLNSRHSHHEIYLGRKVHCAKQDATALSLLDISQDAEQVRSGTFHCARNWELSKEIADEWKWPLCDSPAMKSSAEG